MTPQDWERINEATERAIEHMRDAIRWARAGEKRTRQNGDDQEQDEAKE